MLKVVQDAEASNENTASSSLLDEIVRDGARQMLATALQTEVIAYVEAFADEVDEHGRRLVVRNGYHAEREVVTAAGAVPVRQPRVNDKRIDPATGKRQRFSSAILPAWARKSPRVAEVLPLLYLHTHFGMVRFGAGLVGIDPSETTGTARRVSSDRTGCAQRNRQGRYAGRLRRGTYVTDTSTNLSVLPLGYADGIPREISPDASVEIHGRRHPVVGRVSMDQIVIDTGADYVPFGTTATVFGPQDEVTPTIRDWARWAGTMPHTLVTGQSHDATRLGHRGGQNVEHEISLETAAASPARCTPAGSRSAASPSAATGCGDTGRNRSGQALPPR
ncbi:MAG: hypothetical protein GEU81_16650 [Nitriliruptorales bacterium]|nr:hypothetical protein [Nitriliruptorales bacterium]